MTEEDLTKEKKESKSNFWLTLIGGLFGGGLLAGVVQAWLENDFFPSKVPLNVAVTLAIQNPRSKQSGETVNIATEDKNSAETKFSPLSIDATVTNPGNKTLYLKQSFWLAEACHIVDYSYIGKDEQTRKFTSEISNNQKLQPPVQFQNYNGYQRDCYFVGAGRLLTDNNIKPEETLNAKIAIVYPTTFRNASDNTVPTDFVRVRTYVPSVPYNDPNIDTTLAITYRKLEKAGDKWIFRDAKENEVGVIPQPGGIQWVDISHCSDDLPSEPCEKRLKEPMDISSSDAQFTSSTNEIWVGD